MVCGAAGKSTVLKLANGVSANNLKVWMRITEAKPLYDHIVSRLTPGGNKLRIPDETSTCIEERVMTDCRAATMWTST